MSPRSTAHPWIDSSKRPIYILRFPEAASIAEIETCIEARETLVRGATSPQVWIVDARRVAGASPKQRAVWADHVGRLGTLNRKMYRGAALVITSTLVRGLLTAITWVRRPAYETFICTSEVAALKWAESQLEREAAAAT